MSHFEKFFEGRAQDWNRRAPRWGFDNVFARIDPGALPLAVAGWAVGPQEKASRPKQVGRWATSGKQGGPKHVGRGPQGKASWALAHSKRERCVAFTSRKRLRPVKLETPQGNQWADTEGDPDWCVAPSLLFRPEPGANASG